MNKYRMAFEPTTYEGCSEIIKKFDRVCDVCGKNLEPCTKSAWDRKYRPGCSNHGEIVMFTNGVNRKNYEIAKALVLNQVPGCTIERENPYKKKYDNLFDDAVFHNCRILNEIEWFEDCGVRCSEEELKDIYKKYYNIF